MERGLLKIRRRKLSQLISESLTLLKIDRDYIEHRLTLKQYTRWDGQIHSLAEVTSSKDLLRRAERCIEQEYRLAGLRKEYDALLTALDARPDLRLAISNPETWMEATLRKINKQANIEKRSTNHANLRLAE